MLATRAYIGLNPVAARIARVPETSEHTSIKQRNNHVQAQGRADDLQAAGSGPFGGQAWLRKRAPERLTTGRISPECPIFCPDQGRSDAELMNCRSLTSDTGWSTGRIMSASSHRRGTPLMPAECFNRGTDPGSAFRLGFRPHEWGLIAVGPGLASWAPAD